MVEHHYRSRNEIIASILEVANGNRVRTTEIQFKAYISYNLLREYLVLLLENGLLEYIEGEHTFKTTAKGMQLLHMHEVKEEIMEEKGQNIIRPKFMINQLQQHH